MLMYLQVSGVVISVFRAVYLYPVLTKVSVKATFPAEWHRRKIFG